MTDLLRKCKVYDLLTIGITTIEDCSQIVIGACQVVDTNFSAIVNIDWQISLLTQQVTSGHLLSNSNLF